MTTNKNTKKLVRAHSARTGKRYTVAHRELLSPTDPREEYEGSLTKANAEFLRALKGLPVDDVRFTNDRTGQRTGIFLFIDPGMPKADVAQIARRAKQAWGDSGVLISIMERGDRGGDEVRGSDMSEKLARLGRSLAEAWNVPNEVLAGL